jgi:deoxyribodipyrimidine photo-lyase
MFSSFSTSTRRTALMVKRARSVSPVNLKAGSSTGLANKRACPDYVDSFNPIKISTAENAAAVVADPPLLKLLAKIQNSIKNPAKGSCIVYWMRMADLRGAYYQSCIIYSTIDGYCYSRG